MKLVSPFLKHVVYPGLARSGYFSRNPNRQPAIVTYHGVLPEGYCRIDASLDGSLVTPESLRRQLLLLKNKYVVITPEVFLRWRKGELELPQCRLATSAPRLRGLPYCPGDKPE